MSEEACILSVSALMGAAGEEDKTNHLHIPSTVRNVYKISKERYVSEERMRTTNSVQ